MIERERVRWEVTGLGLLSSRCERVYPGSSSRRWARGTLVSHPCKTTCKTRTPAREDARTPWQGQKFFGIVRGPCRGLSGPPPPPPPPGLSVPWIYRLGFSPRVKWKKCPQIHELLRWKRGRRGNINWSC